MALGKPREEMLADWNVENFTTAPPADVRAATVEELRALIDARPEALVEVAEWLEPGEEPDGEFLQDRVSASGYVDESHKLYIGKEFTPEQFKEWWKVQRFGSLPFNAVGIHHTAIPDRKTWTGLQHLHNTFNYYATQLGWPRGKGPHLWLRSKRAGLAAGPKIYVGTHPASDGIGISYRNHRYLHIEFIDRFTYYGMDKDDLDLYRFVLEITCGQRNMPIKSCAPGYDGPSSPIGCLFHREAKTDIKDCPGAKVLPGPFFTAMNQSQPKPDPKPDDPKPAPSTGTRLLLAEDYAKGKQVGYFETEDALKKSEQTLAGFGIRTVRQGKA